MTPGLLACSYCTRPYAGRAGTGGITCPDCADVNARGRSTCATCGKPLVHGCVFCGGASPLECAQCVSCGEAFAGAVERKAQRDAQAKQEQMMNLAEQGLKAVGQVAQSPGARSVLGGLVNEIIKSSKS